MCVCVYLDVVGAFVGSQWLPERALLQIQRTPSPVAERESVCV